MLQKLDFCMSEIKISSKLKNKTIFQISSSSWFQKCKKTWKKFIFWRNSAKKTLLESRNLSIFLFKKVAWLCIWLGISFKKILRFVSKIILANPSTLKQKRAYCRSLPFEMTIYIQTLMKKTWLRCRESTLNLTHLIFHFYVVNWPLWPSKTNALHFQNSKSCFICWLAYNQLQKF